MQADGTVGPPLLVASVAVAGVDRAEAAARIGVAYQAANILSHPQVDVRRLRVAAPGPAAAAAVAPYDLVRCAVMDLQGPGRGRVTVARVDGVGRLSPPFLAPVRVAGLTDGDAADAVARAYRDVNVIGNARVPVVVPEPAPADAAHQSLPDRPIDPVPWPLRDPYLPW